MRVSPPSRSSAAVTSRSSRATGRSSHERDRDPRRRRGEGGLARLEGAPEAPPRAVASQADVRSDTHFQGLLAAASDGHEPALAELYRHLQPALLAYLRAQRPNDADDLASETWIAAARGLRRFQGDEDDFRRWVFTIARRRLLDLHREEARRPETIARERAAAEPAASPDAATEAIEAAGTRRALRRISTLPPEEAEIVVLRVVAGLSAKDVAAITGRTTVGVRVIQHRALKRLAKLFDRVLVTLLGAAAM